MPGDEDDVRELLAGARAEQGPPLRLDPAAIARDGGRIRRRRRRLQWVGSSCAVVLVLVAVVVTVATLQRGPVQPGSPPPLVPSTTQPTPTLSPTPPTTFPATPPTPPTTFPATPPTTPSSVPGPTGSSNPVPTSVPGN